MHKFIAVVGIASLAACSVEKQDENLPSATQALAPSRRSVGELIDYMYQSLTSAPGGAAEPLERFETRVLREVTSNRTELRSFSTSSLEADLAKRACKVEVQLQRLFVAEVYGQAGVRVPTHSLDCLISSFLDEDLGLWRTLDLWTGAEAPDTVEIRTLRGRAKDTRTTYRLTPPDEFGRQMENVVSTVIVEAKIGAPR
jgi:hypothetical protein